MINNREVVSIGEIHSKFFEFLIALYFFICPFEFGINAIIPGGSVMRYLGLSIIALLLMYLYRNNISIRIRNFHIWIFVWLIMETASYFWTGSIYYAMIYIPTYLNTTFFFILLTAVRYNETQIKRFLDFTLWGTTVAAVIMINSMTLYRGMGIRYSLMLFGTELDPNNLAAFFCYGILISFYYFMQKNNRVINVVLFVINLTALFFTGSRGGIVTAACIILIASFENFSLKVGIISLLKRISILIVLAGAILLVVHFIPEALLHRVIGFESYAGGSDRLSIWTFAFRKLAEKPMTGFGVGYFPEFASTFFGYYLSMHNTFLLVLFDVGIIGFVFFITSIAILLYRAVKYKNIFAFTMLLVSIIPSFFLDTLVKRFFWNGLILCYMIISNVSQNDTAILQNDDIKNVSNDIAERNQHG